MRFKRLCRLTKGRQVCGAGLAAPKDGVNSGGWACVTTALQATAVVLYLRRTDVGHAREGPHTRSLVFRLFVPLRTLASPTALISQSDNSGYLVFLVYIFTQYVDVTWHTTQLRVTQLSVGAAGKEFEKCYILAVIIISWLGSASMCHLLRRCCLHFYYCSLAFVVLTST